MLLDCGSESASSAEHRSDGRYSNCPTTKVGGWPSYIQGAPDPSAGDFAFQIGSEAKANWVWGDHGIGYFYSRGGEWMLHWDCY